MENKGKRKFIKVEEEEDDLEINDLVLGIMEDYSDSIIPPLSLFEPCPSLSESTREESSSRKADIKKEKDRRSKMNENYTLLESLVPGLHPKSTKEKVVHGTIEYIRYLEEKKKTMEKKKKSLMVLPCTTTNTNDSSLSLTISVCGRVGFFGIVVSRKRQGLLAQIFTVFQSHKAEILAANVASDDDDGSSQLAITVTALLNDTDSASSSTTTTIEEIKRDILML